MMRHQPVIVLILLSCVWQTQGRFKILYNFEADNGICTGGCELRERSGASNGLATLMHEGDKLFIQFKTEANCSVSVENIRYSTDGPEQDTINITLANVYLGSFNTTSQKGDGQLWNVFKDSGHVGPTVPLPSGFYNLILTPGIENLGVEVDKITLNFNCDSDPGKLEVFQGNTTILTVSVLIPTMKPPDYDIFKAITGISIPIIVGIGISNVCYCICVNRSKILKKLKPEKRNQYEKIIHNV